MTTPDRNRARLHEIMSTLGRPGYVKEAAAIDFGELDRIPSTSFADPDKREYPCHTKEACWVSAAYMAHDGIAGEPIKRLEKFAASWGIGSDVQMTFAKAEVRKELEKTAAAAIPYALDEVYDGKVVKRFPLSTPDLVKTSADRFYADRAKYPWAWRTKTAAVLHDAITNAGIENRIDLAARTYIDQARGAGFIEKSAMWYALAARQHYAPKHDGLAKLAQIVELVDEAKDNPKMTKLAVDAFATFDAATGITAEVGLPEEKLVVKTAAEITAELVHFVKLADGATVDTRTLDLEKLAVALPAFADVTPEQLRERLVALSPAHAELARLVATG